MSGWRDGYEPPAPVKRKQKNKMSPGERIATIIAWGMVAAVAVLTAVSMAALR